MSDHDQLDRIRQIAESILGEPVAEAWPLTGGEEATVTRVVASDGSYVVHERPPWRTRAELEWVHQLIRHASRTVPQAIIPVDRSGETIFERDAHLIEVFPFINGRTLDRDDAELRSAAARLLARIQLALTDWTGGVRPPPGPDAPRVTGNPPELHDSKLDTWWRQTQPTLLVGATHGDYYRGNLICSGNEIVGVVDWTEASVRPSALELAGATFELCRDDAHTFNTDRADAFIREYRSAGGPVREEELRLLLPLIRVWIRIDATWALAVGNDEAYAAGQVEAFRELATCDWRPA